jgi:hypothetical protein
MQVIMLVFPYTAQPAGTPSPVGCAVKKGKELIYAPHWFWQCGEDYCLSVACTFPKPQYFPAVGQRRAGNWCQLFMVGMEMGVLQQERKLM